MYHFQCRHKYHHPYKDEANVTDEHPTKNSTSISKNVLTPWQCCWWKRNQLWEGKQNCNEMKWILQHCRHSRLERVAYSHTHLPSSFRQMSLSPIAFMMTSSLSLALTGSSLLAHFLLVSVGMTIAWYSTFMSPSYCQTTHSDHQCAIVTEVTSLWVMEHKDKQGSSDFSIYCVELSLVTLPSIHYSASYIYIPNT